MEIEVRQDDGSYANAFVKTIEEDSISVTYPDQWKPDESVSYDRTRAVLIERPVKKEFKNGETFEAFYKKAGQQTELWQSVRMRNTKGDFVVVEDPENPSITEILQLENCRPHDLAKPIDYQTFFRFEIPVPNELKHYFEDPKNYADFTEMIKKINVHFDSQKSVLKIASLSSSAIKKVKAISDTYILSFKQKAAMLQRKDEAERAVQKMVKEVAPYVEVFTVSSELMGLSIGIQGKNISNARKIEGVEDIQVEEARGDSGHSTFKIYSKTPEAADKARNMLEFMTDMVPIPREQVGKIIGKSGTNLQEIVDKTGVSRVRINESSDNKNEEFVELQFTGTKDAIESARLLIEYHLRHLKEMDQIRDHLEELNRELNPHSKNNDSHTNVRQAQNFSNRVPANFNRRSAFVGHNSGPDRNTSQTRKNWRQQEENVAVDQEVDSSVKSESQKTLPTDGSTAQAAGSGGNRKKQQYRRK